MKKKLHNISIGIQYCTFLHSQTLPSVYPFRNPSLSPEADAEGLCVRLSLEEMPPLMINQSEAVVQLGITAFNWWSEALCGAAMNGVSSIFSFAMSMTASFDEKLVKQCSKGVHN